jgi:hypothetical protein
MASHIGCVQFYEHSLCENELEYTYASTNVNWSVTKKTFQEKIRSILSTYLPLEGTVLLDVHFWINDYNTLQSIRVQGWHADRKFMLSLPVNFQLWGIKESTVFRRMKDLPYPMDYGNSLGELILSCNGKCVEEHFEFLKEFDNVSPVKITDELLLLQVPEWKEPEYLQCIQNRDGFSKYFQGIEFSPIVEAMGYSQLAFRFSLSL